MVRWLWENKIGYIKYKKYKYSIYAGSNCMLVFLNEYSKERYEFVTWADDKKSFAKTLNMLLDWDKPVKWVFKIKEKHKDNKYLKRTINEAVSVLLERNQHIEIKNYKIKGDTNGKN